MRKTDDRVSFITLLQAVGIILVIVGHATRIFYYPGGWYYHLPDVQSDLFNTLTRVIYTFHMPLFVFLSGYLCERTLSKNSSIKKFIIKRFKRLFIPYWVWGLLYSVPIWIYLKFPDANYKTFAIGKVMGHLWFLPLLLEVTLIYLILRLLSRKFNFIILIGLISLQFLNFERYDCFAIFRIPEFLTYYFIGAKFFEIENIKIFSNRTLINLTTLITTCGFIIIEYLLYNSAFKGMLRLILAGILGVISLVLLSKILVKKYPFIVNNKITKFLSFNMFTIFLIHEPLLEIILKIINWGNLCSPIVTVFILFTGTVLSTSLLAIIINYINLTIKSKKNVNNCKQI